MENNTILKNIVKWIIALNLLSSNVNAELVNNFSNKQFYQELKEWYNINFFKNWALKSKNTQINIKNNEYINLDIAKAVLDNNYSLEYFLNKYHYFRRKTKNCITYISLKMKKSNTNTEI